MGRDSRRTGLSVREWAGIDERKSGLSLNAEALPEVLHPVTGDAQLTLALVLQANQEPVHARVELLYECDVHDRRAVDADEAARVQMRLELCHREVDDVFP